MIFELNSFGTVMVWDNFPTTKVVTNKKVIDSGYIVNEIFYMDIHGYCYKIHEIHKIERFFASILSMFFLRYWYKIHFTVSKEQFKKMEFEEFKTIINQYVKINKSYYENILMYNTIKKKVDSAKSFEEISKILTE